MFKKWDTKILLVCISLLVVGNWAYLMLKNIQIFQTYTQRDYEIAVNFVQKHIPKNSKVIGEPLYYYAVCLNECEYQYMDLFHELEIREERQRKIYDFEYMILTENLKKRKPHIVQYYLQQSDFDTVAQIIAPIPSWKFLGLELAISETDGFSALILKRKKF